VIDAMFTRIETPEQVGEVGAEIRSLIDQGQSEAVISLVDALEGLEVPVTHLRAFACTEAGQAQGDSDLVSAGARLWRALDGKTLDWIYNLGNAELALFELAVGATEPGQAFVCERAHLHEARSCFQRAGDDGSLRADIRLQALTNLGNSYSQMVTHWREELAEREGEA
jgi:hypothetical protein